MAIKDAKLTNTVAGTETSGVLHDVITPREIIFPSTRVGSLAELAWCIIVQTETSSPLQLQLFPIDPTYLKVRSCERRHQFYWMQHISKTLPESVILYQLAAVRWDSNTECSYGLWKIKISRISNAWKRYGKSALSVSRLFIVIDGIVFYFCDFRQFEFLAMEILWKT